MIRSCKYCLSIEHLCPRCEGPVLFRNITIVDRHSKIHSTSLILCDNTECQNYGTFQQQTTYSIDTIVCESCKHLEEEYNQEVEDCDATA